MTEDEARQIRAMWCPFVKEGGRTFAHYGSETAEGCIGSHCMAWRTIAIDRDEESGDLLYQGYCGLVGRP